MANYITIIRNNGKITFVRSSIETNSENPLTEHELIINELYNTINKLKAHYNADVVNENKSLS